MKIFKRILFAFLIIAIVAYSFICWELSDRVLFPVSSLEKTKSRIARSWGTTYEEAITSMPSSENFAVKTSDGLTLHGKYFTTSDSSTCTIIFPHGWGAIWADMLKYVPAFSDCNCNYVMYDHRAHGQSEGIYATGGIKEANDLWSVTNWVRDAKGIEYSHIGWIGSSWGAATSLIAASDTTDVGFVIADSPFQNWRSAVFERAIRDYGKGINLIAPGVMKVASYRAGVNHESASALNTVARITEPVMLIHSMGDKQTSSTQSVNISKKLNPNNSRFHHTEWGNDHVMDVVNNKDAFKQFVYDFLSSEAPQFLKPSN